MLERAIRLLQRFRENAPESWYRLVQERQYTLNVSSRMPQLDVLRGLAVLMVCACHYPCYWFAGAGWIGVDLFFVLSGFLVSGLLFSELKHCDSLSIGRFYLRRGLKIYPAFYFFLLITTLMHPAFIGSRLFHEAIFVQNYLPRVWGHTWSLAVEEHFYFALPLLVLALGKPRLHWLPYLAMVVFAACSAGRLWTALHATDIEAVQSPTHLRADALLLGVALSYIYHFRRAQFTALSRWWVGAIGLLLVACNLFFVTNSSIMVRAILTTGNSVGFACILAWAMTRDRLRQPLLEKIGFYSYSIYLWHMLVAGVWRSHPFSLATFVANIVSAVLLGVMMAVLVEQPILQLRDRWLPSRVRSPELAIQNTPVPDSPLAGASQTPIEVRNALGVGGS